MARKFGFELLAQQVGDELLGEWEWQQTEKGQLIGDTPIEQLLFAALTVRCAIGFSEYNDLVIAHDKESQERLEGELSSHQGECRIIAWPQAPIENRKVDFLFSAFDYGKDKWRRLVVECDGHNFHERTKEQAARDRSKDRKATLAGYDCFRFTGSEIWRDPWGCAEQITDWAAKGFI